MTLTKADIADSVSGRCDCSKVRSTELVESTLKIVKDSLASGEDVLVSGFGKFCVRNKNARDGRNPISGEKVVLGARRIVTFKCSRLLKSKLNGKG